MLKTQVSRITLLVPVKWDWGRGCGLQICICFLPCHTTRHFQLSGWNNYYYLFILKFEIILKVKSICIHISSFKKSLLFRIGCSNIEKTLSIGYSLWIYSRGIFLRLPFFDLVTHPAPPNCWANIVVLRLQHWILQRTKTLQLPISWLQYNSFNQHWSCQLLLVE